MTTLLQKESDATGLVAEIGTYTSNPIHYKTPRTICSFPQAFQYSFVKAIESQLLQTWH